MSDKKLTFHQKMSNFFTTMGAIKKDKKNPYYNSLYADVNSILADIKEPLSMNGLRLSEKKFFDKDIGQWVINLKVIDIDNPSDYEETFSPIIAKDQTDPQKHIAATTYARRDALVTLLNLPQEDDDGNAAAGKSTNNTQEKFPKPQKQSQKDVKKEFLAFIVKEGVDKSHLGDFTNWMRNMGYELTDDKVKETLLKQDVKLKQLIRTYLEETQTVEAMGG
jgi:hypothetical protein